MNVRIDTSVVRSLAVLAVINSHLELYYPRSEAAIGGLIGLSLFFMASGIGLNASRRSRTMSFLPWYWRRMVRIHPSVWMSAILVELILLSEWQTWRPWNYVDNLLYPLSGYQFLNKLFAFYVPLYFYVRWDSKRKHVWGIFAVVLACIVTAAPDMVRLWNSKAPLATGQLNLPFLWAIFFLTMVLGVWVSEANWFQRSTNLLGLAGAMVASGTVYLAIKYVTAKHGLWTWAFLLLYATGILTSLLMLRLFADPKVVSFCQNSNRLVRAATIGLGTISLEVYLVHTRICEQQIGNSLMFPLNVLVFGLVSIALSVVVYWLAEQVRTWLNAIGKRTG